MPGRLAGSTAVLCLAGAVLSTAAAGVSAGGPGAVRAAALAGATAATAVPSTDVGDRAFGTWQQAH